MNSDERQCGRPPAPPLDIILWHLILSRCGIFLALLVAYSHSYVLCIIFLLWWAIHRLASIAIFPGQVFFQGGDLTAPTKPNFYHLLSIGDPVISKLSQGLTSLFISAFKKAEFVVDTQRDMTTAASVGLERLKKYGGIPVDVFAYDGTQVEAMLFKSTSNLEKPAGFVLIGGNCEHFGCHGQTSANATELRMCMMRGTVLAINFRGMHSGKRATFATRTGMYLDVDAAVHFLHCLGIPHSQITIRGRSLGGAAATEVASWRPGVNLINSRSFSKLSTCAGLFVHPKTNILVKLFGWEMNSVAAYRKVTGVKMMETARQDRIIVRGSRLAEEIDCMKENHILADYGDSHNRPLQQEDVLNRWKQWDELVKARAEEEEKNKNKN